MTILLYVLHEYKLLIHSLRPAVLTSVAEAVATVCFLATSLKLFGISQHLCVVYPAISFDGT